MTKHFIAAGLFCVLVAAALAPAYAEVQPPLKQMESGVAPGEIRCNGDRILVIRDGGSPACVYAATAERTGWQAAETDGRPDVKDSPVAQDTAHPEGDTQDGGTITRTVTLHGPPPDEHRGGMADPRAFEQPLTTLSYPESFELGRPFTINYTWSFFKTFSELHGDEYPPGNLERYPWAWEWYLDNEWEDEDGNTWWQIATGHKDMHPGTIIQIHTDHGARLLTEGYTDGYFDQRRYMPQPNLAQKFLIHPYDQAEDNRGNLTLRIDEPIHPRRDFVNAHELQIFIGLYGGYFLYVHFDGERGHIGTEEIRFFDSGSSARGILENPYPCLTEEEWDALSHDRKRHMVTYDTFKCGSSWECPDCRSQTDDDHLQNVREWLDRNGVTENIREYLAGTLHLEPDLVEEFFKKYPDLAGLFTLPSSFFPSAHATHGNHTMFVYGSFEITDENGMLASPVGMEVCLFDRRDDGTNAVLQDGTVDACKTMRSTSGSYSISAVNHDPEDNDGVELVVGLRSENDMVRVTNLPANPSMHGTGEVIEV